MRAEKRDFRFIAGAVLAAAFMLGGCSTNKPEPTVDPNTYPADYRKEITEFLRQSLTDRADFRGALISPPILRPVGAGQRYMVCVQFNGRSKLKTKVAIYLEGHMTQFIDATDQCNGAPYEPYKELEGTLPPQ
ncbi:MAG TPA: hypothetical protein VH206_11210 [Xanthobacteraceae bacterium]|nr:hypothetical protein [Xanthobacteraceae bacterium]